MGEVLAISKQSKEAIESMEADATKSAFMHFINNDQQVRQMMVERVRELLGKIPAFDITYHGGFKETMQGILRGDEMKSLLEDKMKQLVVETDDTIKYRIYEAVGEYLAGKLTLSVNPPTP